MTGISEAIRSAATASTFPDGVAYRSLGVAAVLELSQKYGLPGKEIERRALDLEIIPERYARNFRTFGYADQARLLAARVAVVGLGGLGGTVAEILAREGVGSLTLVDGDRFEDSNLNRQFMSTVDGLGTAKSQAAEQRVSAVNPSVVVNRIDGFLTAENAGDILRDAQVAIDCLDNLPARFMLEAAAKAEGIPMVSAAIAGVAGHVTTIFPEDPGLALIHGAPEDAPAKGAEQSLGCIPHAIAILSAMECAEAVKIILEKGTLLRNRLFLMDLGDNRFETLSLQ